MRSADSPEDDYLAGRSREEIREERELAATLALARRWEVPASAYDPDSPEPEQRALAGRDQGLGDPTELGLAHQPAERGQHDLCAGLYIRVSDGTPQARGAAGDEGQFSLQGEGAGKREKGLWF